jgi:hypothetical protein
MPRHVVPILATLILTLGCGGSAVTVSSGHFWIRKDLAEEEFPRIKERASFDLKCQPEELKIVTLQVKGVDEDIPIQVGVTGCGQRVVYVRTPRGSAGWVLDSASTK